MFSGLSFAVLVAVLVVVALPGPASAEPVGSQRAAELERLVRHDCGSCHGMRLKGGLGPDIRATALEGSSPEAIARIILDGVPGTPMPPWRPLMSENDARWIAEYLLKETSR